MSDKKYLPCNDISRPICRQFVNQGSCRKKTRCYFYHPTVMTPIIKKKASRQLGSCYCGSIQRRIINKYGYRSNDGGDSPIFFVVCSRTGRSMKLCM